MQKLDKKDKGELDVPTFRVFMKALGIPLTKEKASVIVASVENSEGSNKSNQNYIKRF